MSTLKTTNITHGSNSGTENIVLDSSGNATINGNTTITGNTTISGNLSVTGTAPGIFASYALLAHITTGSYSVPSNNWESRPLTTELDPFSIVTLDTSNYRFSLGAGDYLIKWREHFFDTGDAKSAFRKWDGSSYVNADYGDSFDIALSLYSHTTYPSSTMIAGTTRTTVPSGQTYTFAIRHHVDDSSHSSSGGRNTDHTTNDLHALIEIYKER